MNQALGVAILRVSEQPGRRTSLTFRIRHHRIEDPVCVSHRAVHTDLTVRVSGRSLSSIQSACAQRPTYFPDRASSPVRTAARRPQWRRHPSEAPPLFAPDAAVNVLRIIESASRLQCKTPEVSLCGSLGTRITGQAQYTFGETLSDTGGLNWFPAGGFDPRGE